MFQTLRNLFIIFFSAYIAAVSLPNVPISATLLYQTMGWGQSSDSSATLQERVNWVYVTPVANEECRLVYGNQIKDNMVCAEGNFNEGTCYVRLIHFIRLVKIISISSYKINRICLLT